MSKNNKPEWFEIIENDEKAEPRRVSKSLPVSAVLIAALILGAGVVVGQNQLEDPPLPVSSQLIQTPSTAATTAAVVTATTANELVNPSIAQLPTGDGDDEDDHDRDHDEDENEDHDDYEGEEDDDD